MTPSPAISLTHIDINIDIKTHLYCRLSLPAIYSIYSRCIPGINLYVCLSDDVNVYVCLLSVCLTLYCLSV